jgi:hypothetical protein
MQRNPIEDWQRLAQLYREMGDVELLELDDAIGDLTEVAQQVLRDEMKKRGLSRPGAANKAPEPLADAAWDRDDDSPAAEDEPEEGDLPHEFTWKTPLCECEDAEQAWQLRAALGKAGIESWLDGQGYRVAREISNPRILVAADQLEQAREVAAQPIPQEIIELSKAPAEEFELPVCPRCGADEPVLESVDPVNTWLCESCGAQWADPAEEQPLAR